MSLLQAIDTACAFVRDHPEQMTCAEVAQFERLADQVYVLAEPMGLASALPQVPKLLPELESTDSPTPPIQFISKLKLPGDWDPIRNEEDEADDDLTLPLPRWQDEPAEDDRVFLVSVSPRWVHWMDALRASALDRETGQQLQTSPAPTGENIGQPPTEPPPRLTTDLARLLVTLDGTTWEVASAQALRWVQVLATHPGEWISGPELPVYDNQLAYARPDRLKTFLPVRVRILISTHRRKGSRLRLT
jgi:hypothetical protein